LLLPSAVRVASKGTQPDDDAYSALQAKVGAGNNLSDLLRSAGIGSLYIGGLATDYCVRFTVLDALRQGLKSRCSSMPAAA